jgi:hypothetical protein
MNRRLSKTKVLSFISEAESHAENDDHPYN